MNTAHRWRVALLDDHSIVRHGLVAHLATEPEVEVVGVYETAKALMGDLAQRAPHVLLLDYSLGRDDLDGVSLIRALRVRFPDCRILVLSAHQEPATVSLALRVGAQGFIGKGEPVADLMKAIRAVAAGRTYLSDKLGFEVGEAKTSPAPADAPDTPEAFSLASLSAREQEVIRCFLAGMTVTEIAEKFHRSIKTVSTQKSSAFRKLGVASDQALFKLMAEIDTRPAA
ncbi:response regulator transcription factor [Mitsuaria sp. GD03876]|uniref:response regulator transcription factor n=1 Tax=Mitsuaria sp. GD03876 TaxID=2975399 RepID=UPI00244874AC|nr:response regulator transcription factor [Mitsuaria sp. GD03876]MDH0865835.1 response regulator transcription factor [Mitsuaria sp. GD03876]